MIIEERRKKRYKLTKKEKKVSILIFILTGIFTPYIGFFLYAMEEYNYHAYNLDPPDPDTFLKTNSSRLYAMAMWYEENIVKYHMPHNMIVNTIFNSSLDPNTNRSVPILYTVTYDSAEWTGHYLMAEAFRYAVHKEEGNNSLAEETLKNIKRVLRGVDKILHVSGNGGMARYAWPIDEYPGDPDNPEDENHYKGEWNGSEYIFEDDTSRDMHNGIIMGLGFTYLMVNDKNVRSKVKDLVEDLLDYFLSNGWLYHKPNNDPNGTDLNAGFWLFGTAGIWTLAYLKVGVLVNPDKYGPIYKNYAIERDYIHRSAFPYMSRTNVNQAYYGLLLDWEVLFILIMLEDNNDFREIYIDYISQVYDYTKYDRNAIFNTMWLIINDINRENANKEEDVIIGDIEDCLSRYYDHIQRLPGRAIDLDNEEVVDPISVKWYTFFTEGIGKWLYPFWRTIYQFEIVAKEALTPDKRPQTDFLWSRPPYWYKQEGDGTMEGPGVDYTVVYWLCRYYNILQTPIDYNAKIQVIYPGDT
ncbi:MAG: hypothetical protein ACTSPD_10730 [Promethearchaeota archaeon]